MLINQFYKNGNNKIEVIEITENKKSDGKILIIFRYLENNDNSSTDIYKSLDDFLKSYSYTKLTLIQLAKCYEREMIKMRERYSMLWIK